MKGHGMMISDKVKAMRDMPTVINIKGILSKGNLMGKAFILGQIRNFTMGNGTKV